MASITDTAATSALNEDQYINKLYDTNLDNQNKLLEESYGNDNAVLDKAQQDVQQQTSQYVDRTNVEAGKAANLYGDGGLSAGAQAQVGLSQENAQRRNVNTLREAQSAADAEFQRQRRLMASQYEAAIRQAQADNDMERAQALYDAAKAEEAQLLELQREGAELLYKKRRDRSGYEAIANGETIPRDTTSETWEEVLKNEDALNAIYDAQLKSLMEQLKSDYETSVSGLEAQKQAKQKQTDEALTQTYVDALKGQKNYAETQGAYGQSGGVAAQARLARDIGLQDELTDLRKLQIGADAGYGSEALALSRDYGRRRQEGQHGSDLERAQALYEAAEGEEQTLVENQRLVGENMAKKGDYSILGKLYGLTDEQIKMLRPRETQNVTRRYNPESGEEETVVSHPYLYPDRGIIADYGGLFW